MTEPAEVVRLIEGALSVLYSAGSEPEARRQADLFLCSIRGASRPVVEILAIVVNRSSGSVALSAPAWLFLGGALDERVKEDWRRLSRNDQLMVVELVIRLLSMKEVSQIPAVASHICTAAAACVAQTDMEAQDRLWDQMVEATYPSGLKCTLLGALAVAFEGYARFDRSQDEIVQARLKGKATQVVSEVSRIILQGNASTWFRQSAIRCVKDWAAYLPSGAGMDALASCIRDPDLAEDASEAICECLCKPDIGAATLSRLVSALMSITNDTYMDDSRSAEEKAQISHAVAEAACGIVESSCDRLLQGLTPNREDALNSIVKLLLRCLDCHQPAFLAACSGLATLAAMLVSHRLHDIGLVDCFARVATSIARRLVVPPEEEGSEVEERMAQIRPVARDTLLQVATLAGPSTYASYFSGYLSKSVSPSQLEVILFAVRSSCDAARFPSDPSFSQFVAISSAETTSHAGDRRLCRAALGVLQDFSPLAMQSADTSARSLRATVEMLQRCPREASEALRAFCEIRPQLLLPYVKDLIVAYHSMTTSKAMFPEEALNSVAASISILISKLDSSEERYVAVNAIIGECRARIESKTWGTERELTSDLRIISRSISTVEDRHIILITVRDILPSFSYILNAFPSSSEVPSALCEVINCVGEGPNQITSVSDRVELIPEEIALSSKCIEFCGDCFSKGQSPDPHWIRTLSILMSNLYSRGHVYDHAESLLLASCQAVQRTLSSSYPELSGHVDLIRAVFESMGILLEQEHPDLMRAILTPDIAKSLLSVGMVTLKITDYYCGRSVLRWWRRLPILATRHRIVNYAVLPELYPRVDDLFIALLRAVGGTMSSRLTGLISEVIDGSLTLTAKTMSTNRNKHSFFFCVFFSCYGSLRCNPIQLWGVRAGGNLAFLPGWSLERRLCY